MMELLRPGSPLVPESIPEYIHIADMDLKHRCLIM